MSSTEAHHTKCSNCGAALPPHEDETHVRCTFCGVENELVAPAPPPPPPAIVRPPLTPRAQAAGSGCGLVIALVAAVVVVVGMIVYFRLRSPGAPPTPPVAVVANSGAPPFPPVPAIVSPYALLPRGPEGFGWVDQYECPVGVDANGDGVEDLAGPFVLDSNGKLEVWVGVLDGKDFHLVWKAGPFGIREKATRKTGVAVGKGRMVAVEVTGLAHLYDLHDGKELGVFPYTESDARGLCAVPGDEGAVYIGGMTGRGSLIDLATGKAKPATPPKGCTYNGPRRLRDTGDVGARLSHDLGVPPPDGFDWSRDVTGDDVDGVGIATPKGDVGLVLVGVDAKTRTPLWQKSAATIFGRATERVDLVELGGGVAYLQLPWEVVALDARGGTVKWSLPSTTFGGTLTLTATRLYTVPIDWPTLPLDVYDVATGKRLARLGHSRGD